MNSKKSEMLMTVPVTKDENLPYPLFAKEGNFPLSKGIHLNFFPL